MQPGRQLGRCAILSAMGKGGMGEVWKVKDTRLGREVAIKTCPFRPWSYTLKILSHPITVFPIESRFNNYVQYRGE